MIRRLLSRRGGIPTGKQLKPEIERRRRLDLFVDPLEQRRLLATFVVTEFSDAPVAVAGDLPGSLRQAIFDANANAGADTIEFALDPGTITLTEGELRISDDLIINGPGAAELTISGNRAGRIFHITDGSLTTLIDVEINNLTLTEGSGTSQADSGGAIRSLETFTLRNSSITGSVVSNKGGGIFLRTSAGSTSTIIGSSFSGNSGGMGGGIYALMYAGGTLTIAESDFSGNHSSSGGALRLKTEVGGVASLMDSSFSANTVSGNAGGGISARTFGTLSISAVSISGNSAANGGGLDTYTGADGLTSIVNTTIFANSARDHGGGLRVNTAGGAASIENSTIYGNAAGDDGGGVHAYTSAYASTTIESTSISGNSSGGAGGGIVSRNEGSNSVGTTMIIDGTISGNSSLGPGGGIRLSNEGVSTITGTTISGNHALGDGGGLYVYTSTFSSTYASTLIENTTISGNSARDAGGGISSLNDGTAAKIIGSTISGNKADRGGGVYFQNYSDSYIHDTTILGNSAAYEGGGVFVDNRGGSYLSIANSSISHNFALDNGGGVYSTNDGRFTFVSCTISYNSSVHGDGGGLRMRVHPFATASIVGGSISGNSAGGDGGGIYLMNNGSTLLTGSTIVANSSMDYGGGIDVRNYGDSSIRDCTVSGNWAYYDGGGIYARNGERLTIRACTISDNRAHDDDGGGVDVSTGSSASTAILSSTVSGNYARDDGGGIRSRGYGEVVLGGSAIFGNEARHGGGVFAYTSVAGNTTIVNATISGNSADLYGGGIYTYNSGSLLITSTTTVYNTAGSQGGGLYGSPIVPTQPAAITNSIIAGNALASATPNDLDGQLLSIFLTVDYSLIGAHPGVIAGSGIISGTVGSPHDPMLGPLQHNGGLTPTHALLAGSAAVDAGANGLLPMDTADLDGDNDTTEQIQFDQRGNEFRRTLGIHTPSATARTDMGAFETMDPGASFEDVSNNGFWDLGIDILLNNGELDDGMHTVNGGSGLVLTASTRLSAANVRLIADGDIKVNTNLTSTSAGIFLRSRQGSVEFNDLAANAATAFRVRAAENFWALDRNVIVARTQVDAVVGGALGVIESVVRGGTRIRLRGDSVNGRDTVLETTATTGRIKLRGNQSVSVTGAEVTAGRKLWLQAADFVTAKSATLTANGALGEVRVQAGQTTFLERADVRATRTIYVRAARGDVRVEEATIGILDESLRGTIWLQARDNIFLAGSLLRAPGAITMLGSRQDEALADIGAGTLPAV